MPPQSPSSLDWLWGLEIAAGGTRDNKEEAVQAHSPHSPTYSRGGFRQVVPLSLVFLHLSSEQSGAELVKS